MSELWLVSFLGLFYYSINCVGNYTWAFDVGQTKVTQKHGPALARV